MKTITYEEFLNREKQIQRLQDQGWVFLFKRNRIKLILGTVLIGAGIATLPIPTGSVFMIAGGCYILGTSTEEIKRKIKNKIRDCRINLQSLGF